MQRTVYQYVLWFVELACLITIIYSAWLLVDRPAFAIIVAGLLLATCLYLETKSVD